MRSRKQGMETTRFVRGSGNVFADLGLPDSEEALAKARLAEAVAATIKRRKLTQNEAAAIMDVDQPKVSLIVNGRLDGFTKDRLIRYLTALGDDVEIVIRHPRRGRGTSEGHLSVSLI